jgi:cytochrome c2
MNKWQHHHSFIALVLFVSVTAIGYFTFYKQPTAVTSVTAIAVEAKVFPDEASSINRGRGLTRECIICHTMDEGGPARLGPNLFGIVGAPHAQMKNYPYSKSLADMKDKIWTVEALDKWLQSPTAYAPETKMAFPGFIDPKDRADIIAYLKTLKN